MLECEGCSDWKVLGRFTTKNGFNRFGEVMSETNLAHGNSSHTDGFTSCMGEGKATIQDLVNDQQFNALCGGCKPFRMDAVKDI